MWSFGGQCGGDVEVEDEQEGKEEEEYRDKEHDDVSTNPRPTFRCRLSLPAASV